jgi:hypothetical protein
MSSDTGEIKHPPAVEALGDNTHLNDVERAELRHIIADAAQLLARDTQPLILGDARLQAMLDLLNASDTDPQADPRLAPHVRGMVAWRLGLQEIDQVEGLEGTLGPAEAEKLRQTRDELLAIWGEGGPDGALPKKWEDSWWDLQALGSGDCREVE